MFTDAQLLDECPRFLSVGQMMKALPSTEGNRRFLYLEASNEGVDQQSEVILAKALAESAPFYERYGNIDLEHTSQIGAKLGIPDYLSYEIGKPLEVRQRGETTFVKAEIFSGTGKMAEKANMFWDSVTKLTPAQRWYPSVGGAVLNKSIVLDANGNRRVMIDKVRWVNVGLSKTPVNQHVRECAVIPMEAFAKSWTAAAGLDIAKALEAGYGTDSATLSGGAALRKQSLDRGQGSHGASRDGIKSYFDFRNDLAGAIRTKAVGDNPGSHALISYAVENYGCSQDEAAEHVERFMRDLKRGLKPS
jgi:hypothetical protein